MLIRISARSSFLARYQALQVGEALTKAHPQHEFQYFFRESLGDKNLTDPLWKMPEKGVFTEDFIGDLIDESTDMVVHSWKDLPTAKGKHTEIVATLPRADQRDLLLLKKSSKMQLENKKDVHILSSSLRRQKNLHDFLSEALPGETHDIHFHNVRGNIPTRISKLMAAENADGLILAKAALDRLLSAPWPDFQPMKAEILQFLQKCDWMVLPLSENPNAAAQGALAIEVKKNRPEISSLLAALNDPQTFSAAQKERDILASYGGGCHQKIGIAILNRPYGEIKFLQGLTDQGEVLDSQTLQTNNLYKKIRPSESYREIQWSSSSLRTLMKRTEIDFKISESINALFVSRISAWRPFQGYVWAAGIETWKQLAKIGVWVHGSAEGLGESEDPQIQTLCQRPLIWGKLTHTQAKNNLSQINQMQAIATYEMAIEGSLPEKDILDAASFFWTSGYIFEVVTQQFPQILDRQHGCGPGNTWKSISEKLSQRGLPTPQIFLNENEWRSL